MWKSWAIASVVNDGMVKKCFAGGTAKTTHGKANEELLLHCFLNSAVE
ncbi:MAG: hypothetical protein V7745_06805 [Pseudomonadales bacterium]